MTNRNVFDIRLQRTVTEFTPQLLVSAVIEQTCERLSFNTYKAYIDYLMCGDQEAKNVLLGALGFSPDDASAQKATAKAELDRWIGTPTNPKQIGGLRAKRFLPYTDSDSYRLLKVATEAFLAVNCTAVDDPINRLETSSAIGEDDVLRRAESTDPGPLDTELKDYLDGVSVPSAQAAPSATLPVPSTAQVLPYLALIRRKLPEVGIAELGDGEALCVRIVQERLTNPCMIELIWSYWHEQGMLVQTANAITRRFQNIRGPEGTDPLAMLEVGFLRPLNNLLWGYVQDEQHRLSLVRRAYEYDHHYGLTLEGTAVPQLRPADSRSKFLESLHNLLHLTSNFYKQDDDTTVKADGFPVLNALKDVHMLLSEGAHNQYGDLPSTARIEMLMQQWLLARPEFRELLPTRESVAYPEPWMERVDAMKRLQGWMDTSVMHFRNLGVFGEQILLSIRLIEWSTIHEPAAAVAWARFWRAKIQGYIYAYRAATGVDLSAQIVSEQQLSLRVAQPSVLMQKRLQNGAAQPTLPAASPTAVPVPFKERRAARH